MEVVVQAECCFLHVFTVQVVADILLHFRVQQEVMTETDGALTREP